MIGKCNMNNGASFAVIGVKYFPTDTISCVLNSTQQLIKLQGSNGQGFFNCPKAGNYTISTNNQTYPKTKTFTISNKGQSEFYNFADNLQILEQDIINEGNFCRLSYSIGDEVAWTTDFGRQWKRLSNEPAILLIAKQVNHIASISLLPTFEVNATNNWGPNVNQILYTNKNFPYYSHSTPNGAYSGQKQQTRIRGVVTDITSQQNYLSVDYTTGYLFGTMIDKLNEWINRIHQIVEQDS